METANLFVFGEEQDPQDDGRKRTCVLSHFTFFDDRDDNSMISLDVLNEGVKQPNKPVYRALGNPTRGKVTSQSDCQR